MSQNSMMKLAAWMVSWTMAAACLPEALDVAGKRCSVDRPCGQELFCVEGRCTADAGSRGPNVIVNGTFEVGSQPEGWSSLAGLPIVTETISVHEGTRALSVGLGADGVVPSVPPISSSQADTLYCARAFVWGTGAQVVIAILEGDVASPSTRFESPALTSSGKWSEIRAEGRARGGSPLTVEVRTLTTLGVFLVDDIELWSSAGSSCD